MNLKEIIKGIAVMTVSGKTDIEISGISYDSRKALPGHLFVAVRGEKLNGHDYINDALGKGAIAIVSENSEAGIRNSETNPAVTFIQVKDSRDALAYASNNYFMKPSNTLNVIGVTGTNGKTTTTYLLKSILESWGKQVGLIGTIQYMIKDEVFPAVHTTPESLEFQELLHRMLRSGCEYAVTEVSSHALAQRRVDGTMFKTAIFTNLTRDHLDFHKTMEDYFHAKKRLFTELLHDDGYSIINLDDPYGRKLLTELDLLHRQSKKVITCGLESGTDLIATEINNSFDGLNFTMLMHGRKNSVTSPLMGLPNVYNVLSAAGAAVSIGVPWNVILEGIRKAGTVKGRFEKVDEGQDFLAAIDYAHTEDALERLIYTARGLTRGKIITVFGCGGDRDKGKRPGMGAIATRLSDFVIITSDNPRSEEPMAIIKDIESGAARKNYLIEADRKEAIKRAVLMASGGDVVLVAGKGHETYQETDGKRLKFSDREVLIEAIRQMVNNT